MKSKFAKGLLIYCLALAGFVIFIMILLGAYLVSFQKSLTDDAIKNFVSDLKSDTTETVENYLVVSSQYETSETVASGIKDIIEKDDIVYSKNLKESSDDTPIYYAKVGEDLILKITLKSSGSVGFGMTGWEVSSVEIAETSQGEQKLTVSVPGGCTLYINGVEASADYVVGAYPPKDLESLYNQGFVSDSCLETRYEISGLIAKAEVKVLDASGNNVAMEENEKEYTPTYAASAEFEDSVRDRVLSVIEPYAKFQANDVSFSKLSPYLLDGTEMKWRIGTSDVKWFADHKALYISEAEMKNVKLFDENTFSCNVTFTQVIEKSNATETTYSDYTWVFVNRDGSWYMADMFTNSTD